MTTKVHTYVGLIGDKAPSVANVVIPAFEKAGSVGVCAEAHPESEELSIWREAVYFARSEPQEAHCHP